MLGGDGMGRPSRRESNIWKVGVALAIGLFGCGKTTTTLVDSSGNPATLSFGFGRVPSLSAGAPRRVGTPQPSEFSGCATPDKLVLYLTSIRLQKSDGNWVQVYSSDGEAVDVSLGGSLAPFVRKSFTIPAATYTSVRVQWANHGVVKGTVAIGAKTFYTKADQSVSEVSPAEDMAFSFSGAPTTSTDFDPPFVATAGATNELQAYVNFEKFLSLMGPTSSVPGYTISGALPIAITQGQPVALEIYGFPASNPDAEYFTLFFGANDTFVGGMGHVNVGAGGWVNGDDGYLPRGGTVKSCVSNGNGTYTLKHLADANGGTRDFPSFMRSSHSGSFTGAVGSGSYSCIRLR